MNRDNFDKAHKVDLLIKGTQQNIEILMNHEVDTSFSLQRLKTSLRFIDNGFTEIELEQEYNKHINSFLEAMKEKCKSVKQQYELDFKKYDHNKYTKHFSRSKA